MDSISKKSTASNHQPKVVITNNRIATSNTTTQSAATQNKANPADSNFEYEDNEWDIGIGDLIIDLDADIEKSSNVEFAIPALQTTTDEKNKLIDTSEIPNSLNKTAVKGKESASAEMSSSGNNKNCSKVSVDNHQATLDKGLKMKIKRTKMGNKTSDSKHEIVKSENDVLAIDETHCKTSTLAGSNNKRGSNSNHNKKEKQSKTHIKDKHDSSAIQDALCNCENDKLPCANCKESSQLNEKNNSFGTNNFSNSIKDTSLFNVKEQKIVDKESLTTGEKFTKDEEYADSPPSKRPKCELSRDMVDVCVGTSVGTITEPDCLGPCEPGTSVTLEGIVWHESEGGVLAVNVTWRGKTYVGTLIDCTKHDWAPPRLCDSPTEDIESRLQKGGRAKRGRTATNDLLNFTETRSSVHSKLRNGSKVPKQDKRRKSKDESPTSSNGSVFPPAVIANHNSPANNFAVAQKQLSAKKPKANLITPCAISPVLLECPEQDCSKKYKHANGLKYHQSHAHGTTFNAEDEAQAAPESPAANSANMQDIIEEKSSEELPSNDKIFTERDDGISNDSKTVDLSSSSDTKRATTVAAGDEEAEKSSIDTKTQSSSAVDNEGLSNESAVDPNFFQEKSNSVRCKKNRKTPPIARENVRSPAYSDISDDSNVPIDNSNMDKTISELQSNPDPSATSSMMLGNYGHLSYYQPPSFMQPGDQMKSISQLNNSELKEQTPLDLISKMHSKEGSTIDQREPSPAAKNLQQYQHFPFNIVQTNFSFNGDSSFGSAHGPSSSSSSEVDKDALKPVKIEKDLQPLPEQQSKQPISIKSLIKLEDDKEIKSETNHSPRHSFSSYSSKYATNPALPREEDTERYFISNERKRSLGGGPSNSLGKIKEEFPSNSESDQKLGSTNKSGISSLKSQKDIKVEDKEPKVKNEGQKPTMETQGPPPPPTNQYYLPYHHLPGSGSGSGPPFFADHSIYRNMLVPSSYNSPYHLQMARFSSPEDLTRNPANTKALDLLQQHASQYYNTHKIHELNDRANQLAKSPSSGVRLSSSGLPSSNVIHGNSIPTLPSNPSQQPSPVTSNDKLAQQQQQQQQNNSKLSSDKDSPLNRSSSPPPQRHHHTHHHTHVYPIYGAPYVNPVLASQPPVAVITNPFANPQPK